MYSNSCCSCSFETEIIKIGRSSYKMYSNNILNFQESTIILNACTKKSGTLNRIDQLLKLTASALEQNIDIVCVQEYRYHHSELEIKYHDTGNG